MKLKGIRELMLPLDDYAVVSEEENMIDAVRKLNEANCKLPPDKHPHRAMLVAGKGGKIVGKIGHLAFLKALEPRYDKIGDIGHVSRAGWDAEFITSMMDSLKVWKESFADYVRRAESSKVKEVMRPIQESIDVDAPLSEAVHRLVIYQALSILVTKEDEVIGILRLSDVFTEIAESILIYSKK